jgi:hypothetical protein
MTTLCHALCIFLTFFQLPPYLANKEKPPGDSHFSVLHIIIGKDNFQTVQEKLGPTKKCHTKHHDGVDVAGYADPNEALVFEFGEIGGGDVTGFFLSRPSHATECPLSPLPARFSNLATNGGIRLGMTEQEFVNVFGDPKTKTRPDYWEYEWTLEERYTEDHKKGAATAGYTMSGDTYLVGITIEARFAKGVLQYFYISKLETT